jgi:hypothetical protein
MFMTPKVFDGQIPEDLLRRCITVAENEDSYTVLHLAGDGSFGFKYSWGLYYMHPPKEFAFKKEFMELWEVVKQQLPENSVLFRAYINSHTYGVEDSIHMDRYFNDPNDKPGVTVIVYLCNMWYPEWFGQTLFWHSNNKQENEIIQAVIPKNNRFLIFNKDIPHCVSPLSRRFTGVRLTCMFKVNFV